MERKRTAPALRNSSRSDAPLSQPVACAAPRRRQEARSGGAMAHVLCRAGDEKSAAQQHKRRAPERQVARFETRQQTTHRGTMRLRLLVGTRLRNTEGGIAQDIADASAPRALEKERERERGREGAGRRRRKAASRSVGLARLLIAHRTRKRGAGRAVGVTQKRQIHRRRTAAFTTS